MVKREPSASREKALKKVRREIDELLPQISRLEHVMVQPEGWGKEVERLRRKVEGRYIALDYLYAMKIQDDLKTHGIDREKRDKEIKDKAKKRAEEWRKRYKS